MEGKVGDDECGFILTDAVASTDTLFISGEVYKSAWKPWLLSTSNNGRSFVHTLITSDVTRLYALYIVAWCSVQSVMPQDERVFTNLRGHCALGLGREAVDGGAEVLYCGERADNT